MSPHSLTLTLAALLIEATAGYPDWIFRRIGHPVTWMGALLAALERRLNRDSLSPSRRRLAGVLALATLLGVVAAVAIPLAWLGASWAGFVLVALAAASLPAQRSLDRHVRAVADALDTGGVEAGRTAVSMIVGRNTATLDVAGVGRAAVESLAENFSDGIVGPTLYLALFGLPGGALYKAVNTADSMIGHRSPRYERFGWAAARLDDWVNLPASRLAAVWMVIAALIRRNDWREAIRAVRRDARQHRSPNAGWPEAAMAGALGLAIGGPRIYDGALYEGPYMGRGRSALTAQDIRDALALYRMACLVQGAALATVAIVFATI